MKRLVTLTATALFLLLGAAQASAAGSGFIEGGNIYAAFPSANSVTYKVMINDPGTADLYGVTVTATVPTRGASTVTVYAANGAPHTTSDGASVSLPSGQTLVYEPGSLKGATGNIFAGASVGTVTTSATHYVQFTMIRHNPAPVSKPQPTHPTKPAPVATTQPAPKHPSKPTKSQPKPAETLPPVTFTGTATAPTTVAPAPAQPVTQPTTPTPQVTPALSVSGIENPFIPLFATSIGGGAYALRRSRKRLVDSILR